MVGRGRGVGRGGGIGGGSLGGICLLCGVLGNSLVRNISDESIFMGGSVSGGLDPSIGKSNGVRSSDITGGILVLFLLEVSLAVVIIYSILVGKGLRGQLLLLIRGRCSIARGVRKSSSSSSGNQGRGKNNLKCKDKIKVGLGAYELIIALLTDNRTCECLV